MLTKSPRRRLALAAAAVGFAAPLLRRRLRLPAPVTSALAWQAPLSVAIVMPRGRPRDAAVYALQMWAYLLHYELPNDRPDRLLERLNVAYPIAVDKLIGGGTVPTLRLQRALGRDGEVRTIDGVLSLVHWSWFIFPHAALAYVMLRRPERFGRSAVQMAAVFDAGVWVYFIVPTAPPWWAARNGDLEPVRRIMVETGRRYWGGLWEPLYESLSGNQLAAMPSLHFGTSVMAAHVLSDTGPIAGLVGWSYALTLGVGLVYLGEHYVVDLIAGLALAEGARRIAPAADPCLHAIGGVLERLQAKS